MVVAVWSIVAAVWITCVLGLCVLTGLEFMAWQRLGNRLGIEPSRLALDDYLHVTLKPSMSRDQVHRELDRIAPTVIRPLATGRPKICGEVLFSIGPIPILEPGYDMCYTLDGKLIGFSTVY